MISFVKFLYLSLQFKLLLKVIFILSFTRPWRLMTLAFR